MKKSAFLQFSVIILMIFVFISCKKTGPAGPQGETGPTGPTGPNLMGTLQGFVQLFDQYGARIYAPQDSTALHVASTTALTDTNGKYTFTLTTGTYDINVASRPGVNYGASVIQGLQFIGGGLLNRDAALSKIPSFSISTVYARDTAFPASNPVHYIKVSGTVNVTDSKARTVVMFVNTTSDVSSNPLNYLYAYSPNNPAIAANSLTFSFLIKSDAIYLLTGLAPSQTAYIAVYPAAVNWDVTSSYLDYNTDRKIYNAIGPASINASVVLQ
jgi:hypothetical protein